MVNGPLLARLRDAGARFALAMLGAVVAHYVVRGRSLPKTLPCCPPVRSELPKSRAAACDIALTAGCAAVAVASRRFPGRIPAAIQAVAVAGAGFGGLLTVWRSLSTNRTAA